ncbi:DUF418 domain-containing protein [Dysgonomonas macrotermitis]|uniref:DUF418 domain-containing protein n=1 Tax=Dysgonomonas macrotermitis TaxID=1346286 RepID=A0A1M5ALD8_9BACT|nr:DUF418 domain-containing protein [Dysgonomonas macrotermitis]SHF30976.1 uncharacterized protein SAMN05444362_10591 [Dysgonomonas macrotermitis]
MNTQAPPSQRIEMIDALRGFAILAIFLVHIQEFGFFSFPPPESQPEWLNSLDDIVSRLVFSIFAGKSYSIFALLFGFTFYVQFHNQEVKGNDFGYRFLWRMLILFGFGMINCLLYPGGDILFVYAIVGVFLFVVRKWSNKAILITAIILLAQPMEWIHYAISLFNPEYTLPDYRVGELYGELHRVATTGDLKEYFYASMTTGIMANIAWTLSVGRLLQIAGLFMIGYLIGRKQLFVATEKNIRFWVYILVVSALLYNPLMELKAIMYSRVEQTPIIGGTLGVVFDMWQKLAFTFVIVASFVLLYQKNFFVRLTNNLRYFGRMTLTNYLVQSAIGTFLFQPIGFNLSKYSGATLSFLIGLVLIYIQILFCKWWLSRHKQGPLESVWHKLTWINSGRQ